MLMPFGGDKQEEGTCDRRRKTQARLETRPEREGLHPLGKLLEGSEQGRGLGYVFQRSLGLLGEEGIVEGQEQKPEPLSVVGVIECWLGSLVAVRLSEARGFRVYLGGRSPGPLQWPGQGG